MLLLQNRKKTTKLFFLLRNGFTWQRVGLPDCWNLCISLSLSLRMHTDRHTHSNISLLIWCMTYPTELLFWRSLRRLAYFINDFQRERHTLAHTYTAFAHYDLTLLFCSFTRMSLEANAIFWHAEKRETLWNCAFACMHVQPCSIPVQRL